MSLADLTVTAVSQAIEEFDRIGRDDFLKKYRFGKARDYLL
jgi:5-methylcytosine-specific restriction protein A